MLVYEDIISNDEVCSDAYPSMTVKFNDAVIEVLGAKVIKGSGIDPKLIGANDSEDGQNEGDGTDDTTEKVINIIDTHHLQETYFDKANLKIYMKKLFKTTVEHLNANDKADRVDGFKKGATEAMMIIMKSITDWQFFTGESRNADGLIVFMNYKKDGTTPYFWFLKDCLTEVKC